MIDLYSDTVTQPTPGMRQAIAQAAVGDEQRGEDPTTNALQTQDTVMLCLSKGLGCPIGALLAGSADDIARARTLK